MAVYLAAFEHQSANEHANGKGDEQQDERF
jgi:hypothetical protein